MHCLFLSRLSAPYLSRLVSATPSTLGSISLYIADSATNQNRTPSALDKKGHYVNRVVSQSESSITSRESSANQNRALRHPSRHYVTPKSSRLGVRTLLGSRLESAAIAYLNTWRVLTPLLTSAHTLTTPTCTCSTAASAGARGLFMEVKTLVEKISCDALRRVLPNPRLEPVILFVSM